MKENEGKYNLDYTVNFQKLDKVVNHFEKNISLITLLTTANGIMDIVRNAVHEVLYKTKLHPMAKASSLNDKEIKYLYNNFIKVIRDIVSKNGAKGFIDLFGNKGKYEYSINSKKNNMPCHICGKNITKGKTYGSTYYYCPNCKIKKLFSRSDTRDILLRLRFFLEVRTAPAKIGNKKR